MVERPDVEGVTLKKKPLVIVLSRVQTRKMVENAIIHGATAISEHGSEINGVRVPIDGFENTSIHPSQIKAAKKKYAEAIEWGLCGFLISNGFAQSAQEIYCIAYTQAQMKTQNRLRFKKIDSAHMSTTLTQSMEAYLALLAKSSVVEK